MIMRPPWFPCRQTLSNELALDLWLRSSLMAAYGAALQEPIPEPLLRLARELASAPDQCKQRVR